MGGFNPSKTFGGEKARTMFVKNDLDDFGEKKETGYGLGFNKEDKNRNLPLTPQKILPGL